MMTGSAIVLLVTTLGNLSGIHSQDIMLIDGDVYSELPRFWTQVGLCPAGGIHHRSMTRSLLSNPMQLNLQYLAGLPMGSITHVRIHWMLELLEFVQFTQSGLPIYNFDQLDEFLEDLDEMGLYPTVEFMANPGGVFQKNPNYNNVLWQDFAYKVTRRYLNMFGAKKLLKWRFESWNEPDLTTYNKLQMDKWAYLTYITALRSGLTAAGQRTEDSLHFPLRGPAGLFKSLEHHPLCWGILEYCNNHSSTCPIEILTFHRKGNGTDSADLLHSTRKLLQDIFTKFPKMASIPISNSEADPIAGWSTPRPFQSDVRYAVVLVNIILDHWSAKLHQNEFKFFDTISHDNAFLSYHPHEFTQRTLLAHFRMNNTRPRYSQFVQKPVYAAMGILSKLARYSTDVIVVTKNNQNMRLMKTIEKSSNSIYLSWLLSSSMQESNLMTDFKWQPNPPLNSLRKSRNHTFAYILEGIIQGETDPVKIWSSYGSPAYPNSTVREHMRRHQTPKLLATGQIIDENKFEFKLEELNSPWLLLLRICCDGNPTSTPFQLQTIPITKGEVMLRWLHESSRCLLRYEVWFQSSISPTTEWLEISHSWQVPYPTFQYTPENGHVNGFYKVRAIDIFNRFSKFSPTVEYYQV